MIVCFLGDSLTLGVGDPDTQGWPGRLVHWAGLPQDRLLAYNLGIRRNSTTAILSRFHSEVAARLLEDQEMRLVLCLGSVDVLVMEDASDATAVRSMLEKALANTRAILEQAAPWRTLLVGPPPNSQDLFNTVLERMDHGLAAPAKDMDTPFLSLIGDLKASDLYLADLADGVHPGPSGYELIARLVHDWEPWREWMETAAQ